MVIVMAASAVSAVVAQSTAETGQPATDQRAPGDIANEPEAALTYYNRRIAVFRVPLFGVSPEGRVRRGVEILDQLLSRPGAGVVTTQFEPQGNLLFVDGELAFMLVEGDADRLRGETLASITEQTAANLRQMIADTQEARDGARWLRGVVNTTIATVLILASVTFILFVRRFLHRHLGRLAVRVAEVTRVGDAQVIAADRVLPIVQGLVSLGAWVVIALFVYRWLSYGLSQFPFTRPWGEQLRSFFLETIVILGRAVLGALPDLVVALIILLIARIALRLTTPFFDHVAEGSLQVSWLDRDTARPTKRLVVLSTWLFAVAMAYPYLPGSGTEAFQGISVLLGLMVTFGGSSLFAQGASGLILMYSRTLRVSEYVRIAEQEGTVTELGTFTTKLRTGSGEEITVPNSVALGTVVKNYSRTLRGTGYIVDTTITIGYETPWRQIEAMLVEAARRTPVILDAPPPRVFQDALSDFYIQYRLVCEATAVEPRSRAEVLTTLHANIQDVFNEYGVQIMSPHYESDPASAKVVPRQEWYPAPARPPDDHSS
jgi:small-conductance mechanosensitive channel